VYEKANLLIGVVYVKANLLISVVVIKRLAFSWLLAGCSTA